MKTSPNSNFEIALKQLLTRYTCSKQELNRLRAIGITEISKISHTEYGGFEAPTGLFKSDEALNTFKIKIDYIDSKKHTYESLYLIPNSDENSRSVF